MGDGGKPLYMGPEQSGEDLGLRLAQLRVLLGDMRDRAVVLAELFTELGIGGAARRSSVPVRGQRLRKGLGTGLRLGGLDRLAVALGLRGEARAGERGDGRLALLAAARALRDPAQRVGGELVVGLVEGVPSAVGEGEGPGRAATATGAVDALLAGLDDALRGQRVQMPSDGRLGQLQAKGELGRGGRTVVEDGAGDPVAGALLFVVRRRGVRGGPVPLGLLGRGGGRPSVCSTAGPSWSSLAYFTTPLLRNSSKRYKPRPDHGWVASIT